MPWIPKKDGLRKFREAAGYTLYQLAERTGLSDRQLGKIESDKPPATIFGSTLIALAKTLGCTKEDLATWVARKPSVTSNEAKPARGRKSPTRRRRLPELAAMERESRHQGRALSPSVDVGRGMLELLGPERLIEIDTQYAVFEGERFLVGGLVTAHKPLSPDAAKVIGSEPGVGARFELSREIFRGMPFNATVLTQTTDLTRHLMEIQRDREQACVIVRVLVARPKNKWRGFVGLDPEARPVPYAFVVEPFPLRSPGQLPS
jgi:transcriptional regulator with XRE-family HTH domain